MRRRGLRDDVQVEDLLSLLREDRLPHNESAPVEQRDSNPRDEGTTGEDSDTVVVPVQLTPASDEECREEAERSLSRSAAAVRLRTLATQILEYADDVDALSSRHGQAVKVVEMCQRVTGTVAAVEARAIVEAHATAGQQLPDDATPGGYRRHADRDDGDNSDSWVTRSQITAAAISAACRVDARVAHGMLGKSQRMVRCMPNALDRAQNGDWSQYQLAMIVRAAADLDADELTRADAALFRRRGSVTTRALQDRLRRWKQRHTTRTPEPEADHERGMAARRVEFSECDLFGMRWMNANLPAAVVTAIENALNIYAKHAGKDDPRTPEQTRADVLQAMLFGPAALAPAAADQLGLTPVLTDPQTGYPVIDPEQFGQAQQAWEAIIMLMTTLGMATPAPPKPLLTVTVPLATLLCLRAGIMPGATGAHAPPEGASVPTGASGLDNRYSPGGARTCSTTDNSGNPTAHDPACSTTDNGEHDVDGEDPSEYDREERAYIDGLGYVPYQVLLFLLAGEPDLQRLVTDDLTNLPLDLGPVIKNPTARMRRRVQLRDRTCRFPYCTRPAVGPRGEADLDHTREHHPDGTGGHTADANLACLCREHHRVRHHTAWQVKMRDGGAILIWTNPDLGLQIITRPGGITEILRATDTASD
ncbi:hypothetical protein EK0264_15745 [Epidermidibacterium keratini]|uniref:DUF222 domain-containing protein n=1 Tax=Epidermidibacterium keratini TaxID=1891644 RepID=A0A7L4YR49_9ACTN|nr:HNH endonuclease signature motif containing protein [Epidermidibacterium keratini]QHC01600.1 hypothetical protein EK0264_15745 [Epidermidibacterium keratini]